MSDKTPQIKYIKIPRWEQLPDIDLYLDQVVTFIEDNLSNYIMETSANQKEEKNKIITKTMINNYVKQGVLTPPVKKKYNKTNIASLFVICILKQVYSINEIHNLIRIALSSYNISNAYNSFCEEIETAVNLTFQQEDYSCSSMSHKKYILKNVAQSFASKFYVQKSLLEYTTKKN